MNTDDRPKHPENMRAVADAIREHTRHFLLTTWLFPATEGPETLLEEGEGCGTVGCIGGFALAIMGKEAGRASVADFFGIPVEHAEGLLWLDADTEEAPFWTYRTAEKVTGEMAAEVLDTYADNGYAAARARAAELTAPLLA